MANLAEQSRAVLLVDADNINAKQLELVLQHLRQDTHLLKRAYGDWFEDKLKGWRSILSDQEIEPIHALPTTSGKNATDIRLVVDAMELFYNRHVRQFYIASSDRDFTPLIRHLKQVGATVVGYGRQNAPQVLKQAYQQFISFEDLINQANPATPTLQVIDGKAMESKATNGKATGEAANSKAKKTAATKTTDPNQTAAKPYAKELLRIARAAYTSLSQSGDWITAAQLMTQLQKQCHAELKRSFSCKLFGYPDFIKLLNGIGIFEFDAQQQSTKQPMSRKLRLRHAA